MSADTLSVRLIDSTYILTIYRRGLHLAAPVARYGAEQELSEIADIIRQYDKPWFSMDLAKYETGVLTKIPFPDDLKPQFAK